MTSIEKTRVVILVGGPSTGTRFRPLSLSLPKPLFPIANKPLLWHPLRALRSLPGLLDVVLLGFYPPSSFHDFLAAASSDLGFPVRYLEEPTQRGNASGLLHFARDLGHGMGPGDALVVVNGDVLCSFPFDRLLRCHRAHGKEATIVGTRSSSAPHLALRDLGALVVDPATRAVAHFVEKPESFQSDTVSCGLYAFAPSVFARLSALAAAKTEESVAGGASGSANASLKCLRSSSFVETEFLSIEQDLLHDLCRTSDLQAFLLDQPADWWHPIKTPAHALRCSQYLLDNNLQDINVLSSSSSTSTLTTTTTTTTSSSSSSSNTHTNNSILYQIVGHVAIDPTAQIATSAKIGPNVTIGKRVSIAEGVRIANAVILDGVTIDANACVKNCIVGWDSCIGSWARVDGTLSDISILGDDVKLHPGYMLFSCVVLPHKELKEDSKNSILL